MQYASPRHSLAEAFLGLHEIEVIGVRDLRDRQDGIGRLLRGREAGGDLLTRLFELTRHWRSRGDLVTGRQIKQLLRHARRQIAPRAFDASLRRAKSDDE